MNTLKSAKMLGILAGAGAFAGHHLYGRILCYFSSQNCTEDWHFPRIILHNYPFYSMDNTGVQSMAGVTKELYDAIQPLDACEKIIIACNSLHDVLKDNRLISLPQLVLKEFKTKEYLEQNSLVICSSFSKKNKVFGSTVNYMSEELEQYCQTMIAHKMAGRKINESQFIHQVLREVKNKEIEHLIVGCTELSMLQWSELNSFVNVIDPVELLAKEVYSWYHDKAQRRIETSETKQIYCEINS